MSTLTESFRSSDIIGWRGIQLFDPEFSSWATDLQSIWLLVALSFRFDLCSFSSFSASSNSFLFFSICQSTLRGFLCTLFAESTWWECLCTLLESTWWVSLCTPVSQVTFSTFLCTLESCGSDLGSLGRSARTFDWSEV